MCLSDTQKRGWLGMKLGMAVRIDVPGMAWTKKHALLALALRWRRLEITSARSLYYRLQHRPSTRQITGELAPSKGANVARPGV
ncbi:hypothetical protein ACQKWADRAFT_293148 [Trichoderma austrokoningii]